jgi:hypothetical protein
MVRCGKGRVLRGRPALERQNHISLATGTQWDHEILYRTKSGKWILYAWSQWQGSGESYEEISDKQAAAWLVRNEHKPHEACEREFAALEVG